MLHTRSFRWFEVKVGGLLSVDSRLNRQFAPPPAPAAVPAPFAVDFD